MQHSTSKIFSIKLICFQLCLAILALSSCVLLAIFMERTYYHNKFYKNIQIAEVDLSGKTLEEATSAIQSQYLEPLIDKQILLSFNETTMSLSLNKFFIDSNLSEVATQALSHSKKLSLSQKWNLLHSNTTIHFNLDANFDELAIITAIEAFVRKDLASPYNASISIDKDGNISTIAHENGFLLNKEQLLSLLSSQLNNLDSLSETIIPIDLTHYVNIISPDILLEDLQLINTRVASYSTNFNPYSPSGLNIKVAAAAINNILLMPGETFSFNETVGNTTYEKGYVDAPIIVNGSYTPGVGGGVCQVSSTLYNAILSVGISATERRPHSRPANYVPMGLDAVIDWNNMDLKFQNTLDYPIYITAYTIADTLYIDLYSHTDVNKFTYQYRSETYKVIAPDKQYIKDTNLPPGSTRLVSTGTNGYKVKVTKDTYQDDQLLSSEVLSWDTYRAFPTIYKVGP